MSEPTRGIDPVQELGKQLPWDRPDAARREAVRSSLLVAASDTPPRRRSSRAHFVGAGFIAGALAAAAIALVVVRAPSTPSRETYAHIESSSVAELEHTSTPTPSGTDEVVRIRAGKVRLAVPAVRAGDRVRTRTGDAEVEGTGAYEVVVANDKLTSVHVASGSAKVIVDGQTIVLASGETWTAPIVTADLSPANHAAPPVANAAPVIDDDAAQVIDDNAAQVIDEKTASVIEKTAQVDDDNAAHFVDDSAAYFVDDSAAKRVDEKGAQVIAKPAAVIAKPAAAIEKPVGTKATQAIEETAQVTGTRPARSIKSPAPNAVLRRESDNIGEINAEDYTPAGTGSPTSPAPSIANTRTTNMAPSSGTKPTSPSGTSMSTGERHFQTGWALLRDNKYSAAADELALAAAGDGPLASDARYFQAVALTKAKRTKEAEAALVGFLDKAPTSTRRGRAAVMLGRLIAMRGDATSARAWFTSALDDSDASVAGAAKAELTKLSPK